MLRRSWKQINSMIEKGGDWERRNRYKTYYGIHCLAVRNFKEAAKLLVDSLATFTSIELTSYVKALPHMHRSQVYSLWKEQD